MRCRSQPSGVRVHGRLITSAAAALSALGLAQPAVAHPFGPPPVAKVTADGPIVTVTWSAQPDDLFALGQAVGAFTGRQVFVYQDGVAMPAEQDAPSIERQLASSTEVQQYLDSHIAVREAGASCRMREIATDELFSAGARLTYACPEPPDTLELEITALTDIDPSYRTVGLGAGGARSLHTADAPTQALAVAPSTAGVAVGSRVAVAAGLGLAVVLATAVVAVGRRRRLPS